MTDKQTHDTKLQNTKEKDEACFHDVRVGLECSSTDLCSRYLQFGDAQVQSLILTV